MTKKNIPSSPCANLGRSIIAIGAIVALGAFVNNVAAGDPRVFDKKVSGVRRG
jgi:hypothetical protein